jgi:hypothetical protein
MRGEKMKLRNLGKMSLLLQLIAFAGCAKEIDRVSFEKDEVKTYTFSEQVEDLEFWVDLEVKYMGEFDIGFDIASLKDGEMTTTRCSALDVGTKFMSVETSVNDDHYVKYEGKMNCVAGHFLGQGDSVDISIYASKQPQAIGKLDLIFKQ